MCVRVYVRACVDLCACVCALIVVVKLWHREISAEETSKSPVLFRELDVCVCVRGECVRVSQSVSEFPQVVRPPLLYRGESF